MERSLLLGATCACITVFTTPSAKAVSVLDQSQLIADGYANFGNSVERAQGFTAGISGLLTQIDVSFDSLISASNSDLEISIYHATGGVPNETALGTIIAPFESLQIGFTAFDVSSLGIYVDVGDALAFGMRTTADAVFSANVAASSDSDPYSGGAVFMRDETGGVGAGYLDWVKSPDIPPTEVDITFRTYVDPAIRAVPVPAAVWLFGSGLLGFLGLAKRKNSSIDTRF